MQTTLLSSALPQLLECHAPHSTLWSLGSNHIDLSVFWLCQAFPHVIDLFDCFINITQKVSTMRRKTLSLLAVTLWMLLININLMNEENREDILSVILPMCTEENSVRQPHSYLPSLISYIWISCAMLIQQIMNRRKIVVHAHKVPTMYLELKQWNELNKMGKELQFIHVILLVILCY